MGENACVLFARYGEGGTEVVGPIFFGECDYVIDMGPKAGRLVG